MTALPSTVKRAADIHDADKDPITIEGERDQRLNPMELGLLSSDQKSTTTSSPTRIKSSYHTRRQKRRKLSAYRKLTTYSRSGVNKVGSGALTRKKSSTHHRTKSAKTQRQSTDNGVVNLTLSGTSEETRHVDTLKIRFMHNKGCVGVLKNGPHKADDKDHKDVPIAPSRPTDDKERRSKCPVSTRPDNAEVSSSADDKSGNNGGSPTEADNKNDTHDEEPERSKLTLPTTENNNLYSLLGNNKTSPNSTFTDKTINNPVGTSRTSSWVLVGTQGHHSLRPPTPIPSEKHTFDKLDVLPPIYQPDNNVSPYDWALKSNKVTLSALLKVDHKQACIRDTSLSFDKELIGALQSKLKPLKSSNEHEDDDEAKDQIQDKYDVVEREHDETSQTMASPLVLPPLKKPSKETRSDFKQRSTRRNYTRSTLPDLLPKLSYGERRQQSTSDKSALSSARSGETLYGCTLVKGGSGSNGSCNSGSCVSISSDTVDKEEDDMCKSPVVIIRSESENRERLADTMGFECETDDLNCNFMDDKTLQRAVVLRNLAYHPQAPPSSPEHDTLDETNSSTLEEPPASSKMVEQSYQSNEEVFDDCDYWRRPTSPVDRPTLQDIESLIDVHEDMFMHGTKGKPIKAVRFAELPPKHKRLGKSKSDPTAYNNKMSASAQWNQCFLVAVGENRAIKKQLKNTRNGHAPCPPDDDDEQDDELGTELIEQEMKRYIHWLRHDRAADQHRWLSAHGSHRNMPIKTHHIEPVHPVKPKLSATSLSARVAKAIGLYCVLPKAEPHPSGVLGGRPVKFPKVPVLPPIAGGSNEVLHSRTFTGEVKGVPMVSKQYKKKKRVSNGRRY